MSNAKHLIAFLLFTLWHLAPLPFRSAATGCASCAHAQQVSQAYVQYIQQYHMAAIDQMQRYHIPASITLAQALVESGAGQSELAREANNHFGIKVGTGWTGPFVLKNDDAKNDKFRKYCTVAESYEDHSKFLSQQPRYRSLFQLSPTDYKGWANGLKQCGYATNPQYASMLIRIIETYNLSQYDSGKVTVTTTTPVASREVMMVNKIPCVIAQCGDTWTALSQQTGVKVKKLLEYNEADASLPITPGTNIFLAKKAKKAERAYKRYWHRVKNGESMYSISQQFGMRVKYLYKINYREPDYVPQEGDLLKVR